MAQISAEVKTKVSCSVLLWLRSMHVIACAEDHQCRFQAHDRTPLSHERIQFCETQFTLEKTDPVS